MMRRPLDAKNVSDDRDYPCQFSFPIGYRSGVSWQLILTVYIGSRAALNGTEFSFLILIFDKMQKWVSCVL